MMEQKVQRKQSQALFRDVQNPELPSEYWGTFLFTVRVTCQGACGLSLLGDDTQRLSGCGHGLVSTAPWQKSGISSVPAAFCCSSGLTAWLSS